MPEQPRLLTVQYQVLCGAGGDAATGRLEIEEEKYRYDFHYRNEIMRLLQLHISTRIDNLLHGIEPV